MRPLSSWCMFDGTSYKVVISALQLWAGAQRTTDGRCASVAETFLFIVGRSEVYYVGRKSVEQSEHAHNNGTSNAIRWRDAIYIFVSFVAHLTGMAFDARVYHGVGVTLPRDASVVTEPQHFWAASPAPQAVPRCGPFLRKSRVAWSRVSVWHAENGENRSRCRLGHRLCGSKEPRISWGPDPPQGKGHFYGGQTPDGCTLPLRERLPHLPRALCTVCLPSARGGRVHSEPRKVTSFVYATRAQAVHLSLFKTSCDVTYQYASGKLNSTYITLYRIFKIKIGLFALSR